MSSSEMMYSLHRECRPYQNARAEWYAMRHQIKSSSAGRIAATGPAPKPEKSNALYRVSTCDSILCPNQS